MPRAPRARRRAACRRAAWTPGFDVVGARRSSAANSSASFGSDAAASVGRLPTCVRSGPIDAARRRAANRVAGAAAVGDEECRAAPRRGRSPARAAGAPARRASGRTRPAPSRRRESHQRVRGAAVFRAGAAEHAGARRLERRGASPAGNHVHLAGKRRDPERVDHVVAGRAGPRSRVPTGKRSSLASSIGASVGRAIAHAPPPLLAGDVDRAGPPPGPRPRPATAEAARRTAARPAAATEQRRRRR